MLLGSSPMHGLQGLALKQRIPAGCQLCCSQCTPCGLHGDVRCMRMATRIIAAATADDAGARAEQAPGQQRPYVKRSNSTPPGPAASTSVPPSSKHAAQPRTPTTPRTPSRTKHAPVTTHAGDGSRRSSTAASAPGSAPRPHGAGQQAQGHAAPSHLPMPVLPPTAEAEDAVAAHEEGVPLHLQKAYPWLFSRAAGREAAFEERLAYAQLVRWVSMSTTYVNSCTKGYVMLVASRNAPCSGDLLHCTDVCTVCSMLY